MRGLLATAALLVAAGCARAPRPILALPDFSMTAVGPANVKTFSRRDLIGRDWIAEFVFTRCSGPCPALTERAAKVAEGLPASVGVLCVTVDPEGDTPERLREYAARRGLTSERWVFLRGTTEQTYQLLFAGFRVPMSTRPDAPPEARVAHSTRFVLVDKSANVRGYYDGLSELGTALLARDARRLAEAGS